MKNVSISVIIRTYNSAGTIKRAVESVLNQTFDKKSYEVIVIDDGSTDETLAILKRCGGKIRLIKQPHLGGKAGARRGIQESRSQYIIFLDSDDEFLPTALEKMLKAAQNQSADFVYCDYFEKAGDKVTIVSLAQNVFNSVWCNILFKRETLNEIGLAPDHIFFGEYDLLIRLMREGKKSAYVAEPLYIYYRSDKSMTADKERVEKGFQQLRIRYGNIVDKIRKY